MCQIVYHASFSINMFKYMLNYMFICFIYSSLIYVVTAVACLNEDTDATIISS